MDYWTLKKKAIMGSMQSGRLTEAEGYPLKLENAIKGNMKDYRIWGNKRGKNLLDIPHLNVSTTSKDVMNYKSVPLVKLEPSTTYYYSFEYVINSATERLGTSVGRGDIQYRSDIVYREVWENQNIGERAKFTMSFTTPDSFVRSDGQVWDKLFFRIRSYNSEGFDVDTYNHMLTTTPDYYEYEPYQENDGLGAFGNVDVVNNGKNLFDISQFLQAEGWTCEGNVYSGEVNKLWYVFGNGEKHLNVPIPSNKQITISFEGKNDTLENTTFSFRIVYTDGTVTNLASSYISTTEWTKKTIVSNANKKISYVQVGYSRGDTVYLRNIQIEEGSKATEYEPFREPITTTTIDLTGHNSIMPNDYIDFKNQVIVRSDGTEEDIVLPKIPLHKGYNILTASDAELEATKMYGKYLKKG